MITIPLIPQHFALHKRNERVMNKTTTLLSIILLIGNIAIAENKNILYENKFESSTGLTRVSYETS